MESKVCLKRVTTGDEETCFLVLAVEFYQTMETIGVPGIKKPIDLFLKKFSLDLHERIRNPHSIVFGAWVDDELRGGIIGTQILQSSWQEPELVGVIEWLHVLEAFRRKHIAAVLCSSVELTFKAAGIEKVTGYCWQGNLLPQEQLIRRGYRYDLVSLSKEI